MDVTALPFNRFLQCRLLLEILRDVYHHDAHARTDGLAPDERLAWHQAQSGPLIQPLHAWLTDQLAAHRVEPRSSPHPTSGSW
jgi:hypothetical protein